MTPLATSLITLTWGIYNFVWGLINIWSADTANRPFAALQLIAAAGFFFASAFMVSRRRRKLALGLIVGTSIFFLATLLFVGVLFKSPVAVAGCAIVGIAAYLSHTTEHSEEDDPDSEAVPVAAPADE